MQDFRKKLNVAAALRQQQQQHHQQQQHQQQQQQHNQNMAVFPLHPHHQSVRPPHHLLNQWNLLNPTNFAQRSGPTHLPPPPLMHSPHALAQMPRNPALFGGSTLMSTRFQTPPLHNNLPSQQFNANVAAAAAAAATTNSPFDFYNNKMLMN
ncbi:uncharacterized protein ACRADG_012984 [Cochliomyia hominivorax]